MRGALVATLLLLAASARGDEVVLKSGRTLRGAIVREDDERVTIDLGGGTTSVARSDVAEIRRKAAAPPAAGDAPPVATKPADAKPADAAESGKSLLAALESVRLAAWEMEPPTVMTETKFESYRVTRPDGGTSTRMDRPKSSEGIEKLQMAANIADDRDPASGVKWRWVRLYWEEDSRTWSFVPPAMTRFRCEHERVAKIVALCCKDAAARDAADRDAAQVLRATTFDRAAPAKDERAKLLADCVAATGSKEAGEALAAVWERTVEIHLAVAPAEKVAAAMKRREALAALVAATSR